MGSTWLKLAAAALALGSAPLHAATRSAQSSASETGEGEETIQTITNSTFAFDLLWAPGGADSINVLYRQVITTGQSLVSEAGTSELEVTAWKKGAKGYDEELWTIRDNSNEGEAWGEYYRTTLYGCCGSENTQRSYYAWSGKLAFAGTADPLFIAIPNTPVRRAVSYISAYAADGMVLETSETGAGIVTLVDGDRTLDRILLETATGDSYVWTPQLELSDPTGEYHQNGDTFDLWKSNGNPDPAGVTDVTLVLAWDPEMGEQAELPIVAGKFDLEKAFLPDGLTARRLPAE